MFSDILAYDFGVRTWYIVDEMKIYTDRIKAN